MPDKKTFTVALTAGQARLLAELLCREGFQTESRPYMLAYGKKGKLTVALYEKGPKAVIQGADAREFIEFRLEPEILGEARLGYEHLQNPEHYERHFGIDESGKGDFFGPMVIAGVYVDEGIARAFIEAGVTDSKKITSDARIRALAEAVRRVPGALSDVVLISPGKYNELYYRIGNVNRLLAWGHARVIGNLLAKRPDCPRALSDKFGNPRLIEQALKKMSVGIEIYQKTKAESDPAVAAASILAREKFIDWVDARSRELGVILPRGASAQVKAVGADLIKRHGPRILDTVAKVHFRTAHEIAPEQYAAPAERKPWVKSRTT